MGHHDIWYLPRSALDECIDFVTKDRDAYYVYMYRTRDKDFILAEYFPVLKEWMITVFCNQVIAEMKESIPNEVSPLQ